jgi:hypothetical protein
MQLAYGACIQPYVDASNVLANTQLRSVVINCRIQPPICWRTGSLKRKPQIGQRLMPDSGRQSRWTSRSSRANPVQGADNEPSCRVRWIVSYLKPSNSSTDADGLRSFVKPSLSHRFAHQRANPARIAAPSHAHEVHLSPKLGFDNGRSHNAGVFDRVRRQECNPKPEATIAKVQSLRSLQ